jgi:hypothetical protein
MTAAFAQGLGPAVANSNNDSNVTVSGVNSPNFPYTTVAQDAGNIVLASTLLTTSAATIQSNANLSYTIGTIITFINMGSSNMTISCADTVYLAGVGTTGNRTLSAYGVATAIKVGVTTWVISGSGLT